MNKEILERFYVVRVGILYYGANGLVRHIYQAYPYAYSLDAKERASKTTGSNVRVALVKVTVTDLN
jgi:hypothetical protein